MDHSRRIGVHRFFEGISTVDTDLLACETLLHLYSNSIKIASLLGTPTDLNELFIGHALAEGYGSYPNAQISHERMETGSIHLHMDLKLTPLHSADRIITSSCGACNNDGLDEISAHLPSFSSIHSPFIHDTVHHQLTVMKSLQSGFLDTGGMHAAALWCPDSGLQHLAEDVGRHNAVDKSIGKALLANDSLDTKYLFLSGRCGWDIVAKAARAGIGTIVCIGACSTLAAETARYLGMRIFSFMKPQSNVGIGLLTPVTNNNP
tara:strand:- start:8757 stop:9545 length:789 start_codon:yes stop_codon:yes gene_type:complete